MEFSKDWGSTTTWFGLALLGVSSYLLVNHSITSGDWMVVNGIATAGVSGKGLAKIFMNGKPAVVPPTP